MGHHKQALDGFWVSSSKKLFHFKFSISNKIHLILNTSNCIHTAYPTCHSRSWIDSPTEMWTSIDCICQNAFSMHRDLTILFTAPQIMYNQNVLITGFICLNYWSNLCVYWCLCFHNMVDYQTHREFTVIPKQAIPQKGLNVIKLNVTPVWMSNR